MSSTPTIAEIARIAGVGTATVDRVLNRRPGVNVLTVQRVLRAVSEPGTPQQPGRSRKVESFRFAVVLPAEDSPFTTLLDRQGRADLGRRLGPRTAARRLRGRGHVRCRLPRSDLHLAHARPDARRCRDWRHTVFYLLFCISCTGITKMGLNED